MADNSIGSIFSELLQFVLAYYRVFLSVLITFFIGFGLVFLISRFIGRMFIHYTNRHIGILIRKIIWYLGSALIIVIALSQIGYDITTLIGAAGVFGIAIGLASQTSLSNIISGIFLLSEVAFKHNDVLEVGDVKGQVDSIDLMSIKLRTIDNRLVRVPNEHLIKTIFVNESFYTTRRFDCIVMLHNTVNISHAISVIEGVIKTNNYALKQPESYIALETVEEAGLRLVVGVWAQQENYVALKKSLLQQIKERFESENIPFSYPTLEVSLNSMSDVQPNGPR